MKFIHFGIGKGLRMGSVLLACVLLLGVATSASWAQAIDSSYIVRPGDSYESIATRHGISLSQLQNLNSSLNLYDSVQVGQSLRVPIGGVHRQSKRNAYLDWQCLWRCSKGYSLSEQHQC